MDASQAIVANYVDSFYSILAPIGAILTGHLSSWTSLFSCHHSVLISFQDHSHFKSPPLRGAPPLWGAPPRGVCPALWFRGSVKRKTTQYQPSNMGYGWSLFMVDGPMHARVFVHVNVDFKLFGTRCFMQLWGEIVGWGNCFKDCGRFFHFVIASEGRF